MTLVERQVAVALWSPKQSGLIGREDCGEVLRFNYAKISSEECVRCVPAVVRGPSTAISASVEDQLAEHIHPMTALGRRRS